MSHRFRTVLLIVLQVTLVSAIAGKYLYERETRPSVWVKVTQYDPNLPMRGRYLALTPLVNACSLPHDHETRRPWYDYSEHNPREKDSWQWRVVAFAQDGELRVKDARNILPHTDTQTIWLTPKQSCDQAQLTPPIDYFIPDTAKSPFPLQKGQVLWAEVTVPSAGPPRPIRLAVSENGQWSPLKLD